MPTVTSKKTGNAIKAKVSTVTVIKQEQLSSLATHIQNFNLINEQYKAAQKAIKVQMLELMQAATGLKQEKAWKKLSAEELGALINDRIGKGMVVTESGPADYNINQTSASRKPKWQQEFLKLAGEAKVNEIINATPFGYCYKVEVVGIEGSPTITITDGYDAVADEAEEED